MVPASAGAICCLTFGSLTIAVSLIIVFPASLVAPTTGLFTHIHVGPFLKLVYMNDIVPGWRRQPDAGKLAQLLHELLPLLQDKAAVNVVLEHPVWVLSYTLL